MSKVGDGDDDALYTGDWLVARAIRRRNGSLPGLDWANSLDDRGKGQLLAALAVMENSLRSGRPPAGRAGAVAGSSEGLWELRVTPAGGTAPHHRAFYVREGQIPWIATGITKKSNKLKKADIEAADRIVAEWRQERRP